MNLSKEHKLAFKIWALLLLLSLFISYLVWYFNHGWYWYWLWNQSWTWSYNKYIIFIILSFVIYIVSYFLAKFTIKPIEEHNEKLKEYNHNLAHELKTPISVIKSNLELLDLAYDKELVKSSYEELSFMKDIIDSLLFLSNKNELTDIENLDLVDIFKENIDKCSKKVNFKNSSKNLKLKANRHLINSLIRNLLENASKYWENIELELTNKYFIVKNNLKEDLKEKNLSKLFDTFYQSDNSRVWLWYGLWLSIVKKICDIHSFNISLNRQKNKFIVKVVF